MFVGGLVLEESMFRQQFLYSDEAFAHKENWIPFFPIVITDIVSYVEKHGLRQGRQTVWLGSSQADWRPFSGRLETVLKEIGDCLTWNLRDGVLKQAVSIQSHLVLETSGTCY